MTDKIIDTLIGSGDIINATSQPEVEAAIEEHVSDALDISYHPDDKIRTGLNARKFEGQFKPIKISMDQTDIGIIKKPILLSPTNNGTISKYAFLLKTSPFEDTHINKDNHKSTIWQISLSPTFATVLWAYTSLIFKTEIEVPKEELAFNTGYYVRVKYVGHKYQSDWSDIIRVNTSDAIIEKPQFLSPLPTELISRLSATLRTSQFKTIPEGVTTHSQTVWEIHSNSNFTDLLWGETTSSHLTEVTVPSNILAYNGSFYTRVRYAGVRGISEWSSTLKLNVNYDIAKPSFISPISGGSIKRYAATLEGSPFTTDPALVSHMEYSEWEISEESSFANAFYHNKRPGISTSLIIPETQLTFGKSYFARVRYYGDKAISAWSDAFPFSIAPITITQPTILDPEDNTTISRLALRINTSEFICDPPNEIEHKLTIFEIYDDALMDNDNKVWSYIAATNLTSVQVPASALGNDKTYYLRAKYKSVTVDGPWSDTTTFKTFKLANILTPEYVKREVSSLNFGSDPEKVIGNVLCKREMIDPYDSIVYGKWRIALDANFTVGVMEKTININPDKLPINLADSGDGFDPFLPNTFYYIKAAFKSLSASEFSPFSDTILIQTGNVKLPTINKCEVINPAYSNNQIRIETGPFQGTLDYNESMTKVQMVIASDAAFNTILSTINIDNPSTEILSGQNAFIVGTIYVKLRFYGFYFGTTDFTDVITLNTGGIAKPEILTGSFSYDTSDGVKMKFNLTSSEFLLTENRRDIHHQSNWIFYKDVGKTQILHETGWIDQLTALDLTLSQEYIGDVYISVKYRGMYFQESEASDSYLIGIGGHVDRPEILTPEADQQLFKGELSLSSIPFSAQTGLVHSQSSWKITSDVDGLNTVWESLLSIDLLSKPNIGGTLTSGAYYYAWVKHHAGAIASAWSLPVKFFLKASISTPSITQVDGIVPVPASSIDVGVGNFTVNTSAFIIDPVGYQNHMATLWEIGIDEAFASTIYKRTDADHLVTWEVPGALLSSRDYWIRMKHLSATVTSDYSGIVKITVPAYDILEPAKASLIPAVPLPAEAHLASITFAAAQASLSGAVEITEIKIQYTNVDDLSTVRGSGSIVRSPGASLTYVVGELPGYQTAVNAQQTNLAIQVRYKSGERISPWQTLSNVTNITYA